ncbi:MAG TPA: hypothetical protein VK832_04365, partial [Burkholderiaceae bacterium]|nr:hypothetical protein [Burkholderiaceae bacterium]
MSAVTISNITATPWSFYDTNTNPYTDTIYTMLNQYSIASTNIQGSSAALQATTGYINTNNEQLAMLNEPWTDQSLFPWPTDAGSAFMATQNELVGNGILPDYQYTLASTPELVISPAATSYSQAATNLSTTSTPLVDPGAGVNSMQIPSDAMLPGSGGPNTVGIALSAAPPGTAVIVGSSTFLVASTSVGTELVRASSATLYTGSFDQYLYTLPSNYTLPSPAPSTYAFASSTTLLAPFYESGNTQFYAAPPITNTQLAALSDSTLPGATNPVTPIVLTSAVSTQLGLTGEPPGTAVYVGPQSNNDVYVIAQDSSNPPNTVLVQLTDPLT